MHIVANGRSLYSLYLNLRTAYMIALEIECVKLCQHVEMCEGYVNGFIQWADPNVVFGGSFILLVGKSKLGHWTCGEVKVMCSSWYVIHSTALILHMKLIVAEKCWMIFCTYFLTVVCLGDHYIPYYNPSL